MKHYFDVDVAKKYGVHCAVILENLFFWIEKNKANEKHFYDGHYWTYNSKKAFAELLPYMTPKQIDYAIKKMVDARILITGNYNKSAYDRTLWYAITDFGYSILQNCQMEETNLGNGNPEIVKPIPYINTDNKQTDNKQDKKKVSKKNSFDTIISDYAKGNEELIDLLGEWLKVRKAKRAAMTDRAIQMNIDKLDKLAAESNMSVPEYLKEVICRGWAAFYAINNYNNTYSNKGQAKQQKEEVGELTKAIMERNAAETQQLGKTVAEQEAELERLAIERGIF